MKLRRSSVLALMALPFLVLFFQNCAGGFESAGKSSLTQQSSGDGNTDPDPPVPPSPTPADKVDVFMAAGHMGRTIMSCDDGKTWINDRSENDATRCWVTGDANYLECDHTPYSFEGIDEGDGYFFTAHGWGYNGSAKKSRDGINWEVIKTDGWGGGIVYAKNVLLLLWSSWFSSADLGAMWNSVMFSPYRDLDHPHIKRVGNKFLAYGRAGGAKNLVISYDQGVTWETPVGFEADWADGYFAQGNGVLVSVGAHRETGQSPIGYVARSTDGGRTWSATQVGQDWSGLIFNGQKFIGWSAGKVYTSRDAITWDSTPIVVSGFNPLFWKGPKSFNPHTGTYVSILAVWGNFYEKQKAYRSSDGITWNELDAASFKGGHPLHQIVQGQMDKQYCP